MDPVTHLLSGAVLGRAWARPGGRLGTGPAVAGGALAAAFPDIDYAAQPFVDPLTFLTVHRGITHSLILLPLWALAVAAVLALLWRRGPGWRDWYPLTVVALLLHVTLDALTSYGTQLFAPVTDAAVAVPLLFIIDPVVSGTLLLALLISLFARRSRVPALAALATLTVYAGVQTVTMQRAEALGTAHARGLGLEEYRVSALAQPLSPLHWKVVVEHGEGYRVALVDLGAQRLPAPVPADAPLWRRANALYRPPEALEWRLYRRFGTAESAPLAREAWQAPALAAYRAFARYPYLEEAAGTCASFADLRFALADLRVPFHDGACREADGWWVYRVEAGRKVPL